VEFLLKNCVTASADSVLHTVARLCPFRPPVAEIDELVSGTADGTNAWAPPRRRVDNAMVKAVARAFRWRMLIETEVYGTIRDLAAMERINSSYVSRVLRLTLLAPDIIEAILNGHQPSALQLVALLSPFPLEWEQQRWRFGI
jgi:hypothetical protein